MASQCSLLRVIARTLVRCAVSGRVHSRDDWQTFLERQLDGIKGDMEALIWATGCLWALRIERLIARAPPIVNCALFLAGLHLGVNILLAHLIWYGFPRTSLELEADGQRTFIKLALFLGVVAVVGFASPGSPRRRIFAAAAFPLLGLLAMLAVTAGMELVNIIRLPGYPLIEAMLRGLMLGMLIAGLLSLPAVLLYRSSGVPVAILCILPAMAKADASASYSHSGVHVPSEHARLFLFAILVVALFTYECGRLQGRPLDARRGG